MMGGDTCRTLLNSTGPGSPIPRPLIRPAATDPSSSNPSMSSQMTFSTMSGPSLTSMAAEVWWIGVASRSLIATSTLVAPNSMPIT